MKNANVDAKRLRIMIGILGILLPWIVAIATLSWPASISITYYSLFAVGIFMIVLGSASTLLISYKGYDLGDDITSTIAGIFGLIICLFPTAYPIEPEIKAGILRLPSTINVIFHYIGAIGFFITLAYMSFFRFTRTNGGLTHNKIIRNRIYRICGIGMLFSFLLLLLKFFAWCPYNLVWIIETIGLTFFGFSWCVKSGALPFLHDNN